MVLFAQALEILDLAPLAEPLVLFPQYQEVQGVQEDHVSRDVPEVLVGRYFQRHQGFREVRENLMLRGILLHQQDQMPREYPKDLVSLGDPQDLEDLGVQEDLGLFERLQRENDSVKSVTQRETNVLDHLNVLLEVCVENYSQASMTRLNLWTDLCKLYRIVELLACKFLVIL